MKNYILSAAILLFTFSFANGQVIKKPQPSVKFNSVLQLGILEGSAEKTYGQLQLVNGLQRNAWFYGLGLGIDYYGAKRSLPLFFDVKRNLGKGKNIPFIFADAGYNFSWLRDKDKIDYWGTDYKSKGGLYYETGLGYKFISKSKLAFGFSAGYSFKQQEETFSPYNYIGFDPTPQPNRNSPGDLYTYKFRRISLKFNCWF